LSSRYRKCQPRLYIFKPKNNSFYLNLQHYSCNLHKHFFLYRTRTKQESSIYGFWLWWTGKGGYWDFLNVNFYMWQKNHREILISWYDTIGGIFDTRLEETGRQYLRCPFHFFVFFQSPPHRLRSLIFLMLTYFLEI
jgi:hypothetical protein